MKNTYTRALRTLMFGGLIMMAMTTQAVTIFSDGSDGALSSGGTLALDTDGIFNFTTINIPDGAELRLTPNAANTPAVLAATGDVVINGTITVSAGHFNRLAYGPGGGTGGLAGNGPQAGTGGSGPSPGQGGEYPAANPNPGNAGGGGGMGTPGLVATQYSNSDPAAGGPAIGFPGPVGGSGGGGGSGAFRHANLSGGVGGAGGGGLLITTPGTITLNGSIIANGGHAGWAFANVFGHGGPGGGSGGNVMLEAVDVTLGATAIVSAIGGAGGGLGTQRVPDDPFLYSNGAHGGLGYLVLEADTVNIDPAATINAAVVPVPPALWLFGSALFAGVARRRRIPAI